MNQSFLERYWNFSGFSYPSLFTADVVLSIWTYIPITIVVAGLSDTEYSGHDDEYWKINGG